MQGKLKIFSWIVIFIILAIPIAINSYYIFTLFTLIIVYAVAAAGLNIWAGFHGELSLGHGGLFAIGAYAAAIATTRLNLSPATGLVFASVIAGMAGAVIALPALRVRGAYLVVLTLGFAVVIYEIANNAEGLTGGPQGIGNIPSLGFSGMTFSPRIEYLFYLIVLAITLLLIHLILHSYWGRAIVAVKDSEIATLSIGLNAGVFRLFAFVLSSMFTGVGGALLAYHDNFISPETFSLHLSILLLLMVIVGGRDTEDGPVVGAVVMTLLPNLVRELADWQIGIYGALTILILLFMPQGIVGFVESLTRKFVPESGEKVPGNILPDSRASINPAVTTPVHLSVRDIVKDFAGLRALNGITIDFQKQGIHGLIGPNGSGKTTLINIMSGFYRVDYGQIMIDGRSLDRLSPRMAARNGITRTFQLQQVFGSLTVMENVMLAQDSRLTNGLPLSMNLPGLSLTKRSHKMRQRAMSFLNVVGLDRRADIMAGQLSYSEKRLLEIARCLALEPKILLLDEPAAGMNEEEIAEFGEMLLQLKDSRDLLIILCEHHFDLIKNVCEKVTVLDMGMLIANGDISEIKDDPKVIEAYIGA